MEKKKKSMEIVKSVCLFFLLPRIEKPLFTDSSGTPSSPALLEVGPQGSGIL